MKNKKNKIIIGITVVVAIIVVAIAIVLCLNKFGDSKNAKQEETILVTDAKGKVIKTIKKKTPEEKSKEKASIEENKKKQKEAWDNVEVVEEGTKAKKDKQVIYKTNKKGEIVTKKNGEKVTRKPSYAGEDEGWSPMVTPDDLKK